MDEMSRDPEEQLHATNLERTLKELQRKVKDHESELRKIRSTQHEVPESAVAQAKVIKTALANVTSSEPFLPFPESVLPALLAMRKAHETIQDSQAYLASQGPGEEKQKRRLEAERANLKDQGLLTEALTSRIQSLQTELSSAAEMQPEDGLRERVDELKKSKKNYDKETSKLMKALLKFIDKHLAAMLAAEELGGPVVGDLMDIDTEDLAGGFSSQGKLKKAKEGASDDKRQRRIDEIWGPAADANGGGGDGAASRGGGQQSDETSAAGAEMRELTEELLNRLSEARGDLSSSYVTLARESAAARFLVRSKVAQFHPKDATRLKLVDFARDLED